MSERYPGGIITKSPATPTGPYQNGTASGVWTLDQQLQYQQQGIWPTAGLLPNYIEDVFSTYLYTGTGATQTITNGIDLSGKGGLVWLKDRSQAYPNSLYDSARGVPGVLHSDDTSAATTAATQLNAFNSNGFTIGGSSNVNNSGSNLVSWTFRKQAKFFDVQTFTSNSSKGATVNHNLGVTPSFVIIKCTGATEPWWVWHTSMPSTSYYMILNGTQAQSDGGLALTLSSTQVVIPSNYLSNASTSYVMYVYASNAGGFGSAGTDNVITCGSYTTDGSGNGSVTLGYEPQFVLDKITTVGDWRMFDNMRGIATGGVDARLLANDTQAEYSAYDVINLTSTGFTTRLGSASTTYIYIAIRRGPMATPTDATKVFLPNNGASSTSGQTISTTFPVDLIMSAYQTQGYVGLSNDRLRGISNTNTAGTTPALQTSTTDAESAFSAANPWFIKAWNNSITRGSNGADPVGGIVSWLFGRAPGFCDVVCYTGTGTTLNPSHNLGVIPELKIIKCRSSAVFWTVGGSIITGGTQNDYIVLNQTAATVNSPTYWSSGADSSTTFSTRTGNGASNDTGQTFVAYLFATCPGVSKVGSYTGNGTTQTINCGFGAGGARFVLIKRTDSTGDWYVYDTARGMTVLTDPYLLLNSTGAETATLGSVTTVSTGFALNSSILAAINVNAGTYIFLAIA